jgi:hypothetical protein
MNNDLESSVYDRPNFLGFRGTIDTSPLPAFGDSRAPGDRIKSELMEKDRIIEAKNKEITSLTLQIEEIISN